MRQVTREQYEIFLKDYKRTLTPHTIGFCTPPIREHHDLAIGTPYGRRSSLVAYRNMMAGSQGAGPADEDEYFILISRD